MVYSYDTSKKFWDKILKGKARRTRRTCVAKAVVPRTNAKRGSLLERERQIMIFKGLKPLIRP